MTINRHKTGCCDYWQTFKI